MSIYLFTVLLFIMTAVHHIVSFYPTMQATSSQVSLNDDNYEEEPLAATLQALAVV